MGTDVGADSWADDFAAFHALFASVFGRREGREQAAKYMRGLMATAERHSAWQIAEATGDKIPDATQRLLYRTLWDADTARDILLGFIVAAFGDDDGIGVVDETGFIKKGKQSVGVQRQYSGTAGKIENSQVGTFLTYSTAKGHVFLDRRLYLPKQWCEDAERRARAKVPDSVSFETKPEQAMRMLEHAWEQGVPMRWVAGDEVYGDATELRDCVRTHQRLYVLAVPNNTLLWANRPPEAEARREREARPRAKAQLAEGVLPATTVLALALGWPDSRWQRLTIAEGAKGPRIYDWAYQRIVESRDRLPGPDGWLIVRRSLTDPADLAYFLSNAPADTPLLKLAQVAGNRYTIEQCFEEGKGETGLDQYAVRYWHSWYRHITLSMMAHAWLASVRNKAEAQKGAPSPSWQP